MRWAFRSADGQPIVVRVVSRFMVNESEPLLTACLAGLDLILQPLELVSLPTTTLLPPKLPSACGIG